MDYIVEDVLIENTLIEFVGVYHSMEDVESYKKSRSVKVNVIGVDKEEKKKYFYDAMANIDYQLIPKILKGDNEEFTVDVVAKEKNLLSKVRKMERESGLALSHLLSDW
jgi:inorganic pyrophosphatase